MTDSSNSSADNQIIPFDFGDNRIRVTRDDDGEPWFIAADVCKVLELSNVGQALSRLDDDEKRNIISNDVIGKITPMAAVNESGLYSMVLSSRKPEAKAFKRWITHDVLPSIRKTGQYSITPTPPKDHILAMLDSVRETRLAQIALEQRVNQIEARQDAVDTELHHFTVIGYFRTRGKAVPDKTTLQTIGKQVSNVSRQLGYTIGKVKDERYGTVHTYHEDMLRQVLNW